MQEENINSADAHSALEKHDEKIRAIVQDELRQLSIAIVLAVQQGNLLVRAATEDLDHFVSTFVNPPLTEINNLSEYILALWLTQVKLDYITKIEEKKKAELLVIAEEVLQVRSRFLDAGMYLWRNNKNVRRILAAIKRGRGYVDRANDLIELSDLFMVRIDEVLGEIGITEEDIRNLTVLGDKFMKLINPPKDSETSGLEEAKLLRAQAFTLFANAYEEVHSAAHYIFRNDPERLEEYPSLHSIVSKK